MTVERMSAMLPVSDEMIVDYGIGTPDDQLAAAQRLESRRLELETYWRSLPRRTRLIRRVAPRWYELRHRWTHAVAALRGMECD